MYQNVVLSIFIEFYIIINYFTTQYVCNYCINIVFDFLFVRKLQWLNKYILACSTKNCKLWCAMQKRKKSLLSRRGSCVRLLQDTRFLGENEQSYRTYNYRLIVLRAPYRVFYSFEDHCLWCEGRLMGTRGGWLRFRTLGTPCGQIYNVFQTNGRMRLTVYKCSTYTVSYVCTVHCT